LSIKQLFSFEDTVSKKYKMKNLRKEFSVVFIECIQNREIIYTKK